MNLDKFEIRSSQISGKGLFAAKPFTKGETVLKWNPKVLSKEEYKNLPEEEKTHYVYKDKDDYLLMQPPERYVNHSCDPNTKVVNRSDVAIKNIKSGDEITSDYIDKSDRNFVCRCGSEKCKFNNQ